MAKEIERKWLLSGFPELNDSDLLVATDIVQAYLSKTNNEEVRIRGKKEFHKYQLDRKTGEGLIRDEVSVDITKETFEKLYRLIFNMSDSRVIHKEYRRYHDPHTGLHLEMSLVNNQFYYCEIEFESEDSAREFQPYPWMGEEVTDDSRWSMSSYAFSKDEDFYQRIPR